MSVAYSVIIPAFNEEELLAASLDKLFIAMKSNALSGEIIVVDNNSCDRTSEIARNFGVTVVFEPLNQISRARNAGAKVAKGKYLIFLDADTIISPELLNTALGLLGSGNYCGGGVLVEGDSPLPKPMQCVLDFWNWFSLRYGFAAGCFIYCLHDGFDAIVGFSERVYASEEIWFSIKLKYWGLQRGLKFKIISSPRVVTSMRKLEWYSPWQLFFRALLILLFPPSLCFRALCVLWYQRPDLNVRKDYIDR